MESRETPGGSREEGTGQPPQTAADTSPSKDRDKWDKFEILLRPAAAFLTAITVALIGWFGQRALSDQTNAQTQRMVIAEENRNLRAERSEKEATRRAQMAENYRLYTQLLSNREEAESGLRKDIFSSILKEFLSASGEGTDREFIRNRILKLEILSLNFGETLSLSPLFVELNQNILDADYGTEFPELDKRDDRKRLESLAKRVSAQQITALSTGGYSWDFEIPIPEEVEEKPTGQAEATGLVESPVSRDLRESPAPYDWPRDAATEDTDPEDIPDFYETELEGVSRTYRFLFSEIDAEFHTVTVELEILKAGELTPVEQKFKLDFYNFPMVDNTRLSDDQRFALMMTKFETKGIHFSAIVFPGKYSSQRDKPFLDDVISRLRDETQKQEAESLPSEEL